MSTTLNPSLLELSLLDVAGGALSAATLPTVSMILTANPIEGEADGSLTITLPSRTGAALLQPPLPGSSRLKVVAL